MPFSSAAMRTELQTDPAGIGYAAFLQSGNDSGLLAACNLIRSGTPADGKTYTTFRNDIKVSEVIAALDPTEYAAVTDLQLQKLMFIATPGVIDATLTNIRSIIGAIFAAGNTRTALVALASRNASRMEVLFGANITPDQLASAR